MTVNNIAKISLKKTLDTIIPMKLPFWAASDTCDDIIEGKAIEYSFKPLIGQLDRDTV